MPCIELDRVAAPPPSVSRRTLLARGVGLSGAAALGILAGCASAPNAPLSDYPAPPRSSGGVARSGGDALPPPGPVRSWNELRLQAARRMVSANPSMTYMGEPPEPLLAIPVLEVELNADGSIRRIEVMRRPSQAEDTIQLAADAVRRAAPFGDVSRLPRPWRFTETFLFDDDRKFKPRSLDQ